MFNFAKKDFNVVQKFPMLILISVMIILCGAIFMLGQGLNLGIDYEGGAKVEIELADEMNISRSYISRLEKKILGKLRKDLSKLI